MQERIKESFIQFVAPVASQTTSALFQIINDKLKHSVQRVHIMISSPGGTVFHGLSIYNFLKGAPIEVYTYNFGSVDSIGVIVYCSGIKRYCVPHARFLIHGISLSLQEKQSFDEKGIEEILKSIKIDYQNVAKVIADTVGKEENQIQQDMNNRTTLNPLEAKTYGLVHEIKSDLFPINADLSVIDESFLTRNRNESINTNLTPSFNTYFKSSSFEYSPSMGY